MRDFGDVSDTGLRQRRKVREGTTEWKGKKVFKK